MREGREHYVVLMNLLPNIMFTVLQLRIRWTGGVRGREKVRNSQVAQLRLKLYPEKIRYRNRLPAKVSYSWTDLGEAS